MVPHPWENITLNTELTYRVRQLCYKSHRYCLSCLKHTHRENYLIGDCSNSFPEQNSSLKLTHPHRNVKKVSFMTHLNPSTTSKKWSSLKGGNYSGAYQTFQILHCTLKCSRLKGMKSDPPDEKKVDYNPDKVISSDFPLAFIHVSEHSALTHSQKCLKFLTWQCCLFCAQATHSGKGVWPEA